MKLADKIMQERKKQGWSQEELAERLDVSRQSVSKWESGLSTPDLDKIVSMSSIFGVTTDYLIKETETPEESTAEPEPVAASASESRARRINRTTVEAYFSLVKRSATKIALGVALCILSPIALILLAGMAEALVLSEALAVGIGLLVLFAFVGAALTLLIPNGMRLSEYEYLEKEVLDVEADALALADDRRRTYERSHRIRITLGTLCCLFSVIPLVLVAVLTEHEIATVCMVGVLLACVAVGVFQFVLSGMVMESYEHILQVGEYEKGRKVKNVKKELIESIYWGLIVVAYLLVSFLTGAWHLTWLFFVVGGILSSLLELFFSGDSKK